MLSLDGNNYNAFIGYAKLFNMRDKDCSRTILMLEKIEMESLNDPNALFDMGMLFLKCGQPIKGRNGFLSSAKFNPTIDRKLLGKLYLYYKEYSWAIEELKLYLSDPNHAKDVEVLLLLAETEDIDGNQIQAEYYFRQVIQLSPNNVLAHAGLGLLLLGISSSNYGAVSACGLHQEEAIGHLNKAFSLDKNVAIVREALQFCALEAKEVKEWNERIANIKSSDFSISENRLAKSPMKYLIRLKKKLLLHIQRILRRTKPSSLPVNGPATFVSLPSVIDEKIQRMEKVSLPFDFLYFIL